MSKGKEAYGRALEIAQRLYEERPRDHDLRVDYGVTLAAMGDLMTEEKQSLAIPWYDQAITHLAEIYSRGEKAGMVKPRYEIPIGVERKHARRPASLKKR